MGPEYLENWRQDERFLPDLFAAFPDIQEEGEDMVGEGDQMAVRTTMRGTHGGTFIGAPATGKQVTEESMHIWRLADGLITEHWVVNDWLGPRRQLDAVPSPQAHE